MTSDATTLIPLSTLITVLEWSACALGLLGAFVLATNTRISRWGWVAFLLANLCALGFAWGLQRYGLMLQQGGFLITSLLGMARTGLLSWPAFLDVRWPGLRRARMAEVRMGDVREM